MKKKPGTEKNNTGNRPSGKDDTTGIGEDDNNTRNNHTVNVFAPPQDGQWFKVFAPLSPDRALEFIPHFFGRIYPDLQRAAMHFAEIANRDPALITHTREYLDAFCRKWFDDHEVPDQLVAVVATVDKLAQHFHSSRRPLAVGERPIVFDMHLLEWSRSWYGSLTLDHFPNWSHTPALSATCTQSHKPERMPKDGTVKHVRLLKKDTNTDRLTTTTLQMATSPFSHFTR
jgi:hypothetical protein